MIAKKQKFFADWITRRFETNLNGVYMFCKIETFLTRLMTNLSLTKKKLISENHKNSILLIFCVLLLN